ncbi:hypothetical protein [Caballeronia sp. GAWG1-1]|uniref:hypothetical protein n=1 Tax=Caballeronia sp. GAWG1-1 TaxID=2921742 RepID=UPI0020296374|nr:hypothetical protein [Caballeronia sp. GAWG1-1]
MDKPTITDATSAQEIAALMAFPGDGNARNAYALHQALYDKIRRGESVMLSADHFVLLTWNSQFAYPRLMDDASEAIRRAKIAAWELVRQWLSVTDDPPSFEQLRREHDDLAGKRTATDKNTFLKYRRAAEPVIHLWMAWHAVYRDEHMTDERFATLIRTEQGRRLFLYTANAAAEWLACQVSTKGRQVPVNVDQLIPITL